MKRTLLYILILLAIGAVLYFSNTADTQGADDPTVVSTNPRSGASDVATNASVHAYFSEPMDPSTITSNTFTVASSFGSVIPGEVTYANQAAAFIPFTHMDEMATYKATISDSVTDSTGNSMGSSFSWSFQTASE